MKNKTFSRKLISALILIALFTTFQAEAKNKELVFNKNKTFKIVQFTDVHYCPMKPESEAAITMIEEVLTRETPDLVVFTGDIVTGKPAREGWSKVLAPVIKLSVPYAVTLGNHDDEQDLKRREIAQILVDSPGCLFVDTIPGVSGVGNYVLPVKSSTNKNETAAVLYCIDSNTYYRTENRKDYGWIKRDQIDWYTKQSAEFTKSNGGQPLPSLAFFHIPLPEFNQAFNFCSVGKRKEQECPPKLNSGMFTAMKEMGDVMGVFVGHDHDNDYIGYLYGIALAYGRFTGGKTIYINMDNGARVIELKEGERKFDTWVRLSDNRVIEQVAYPKDFLKK